MEFLKGDALQEVLLPCREVPLILHAGKLPQGAVHQADTGLVDPAPAELRAFVHSSGIGDPVHVQDLVGPEAQQRFQLGLQFPQRPPHGLLQVPVEGPRGPDGPVDEGRHEPAVGR